MTTDQILEVQRRAVERGDRELLEAAWGALGYSQRYAFAPVSEWERRRCLERCAAELSGTSRAARPA
jgi:hypothetical protein